MHLGRIRKLYALHSLSLHDVGEFSHGGLHPGYAFPLWHGCMAVVARLAGVDPTSVVLHEPSLLVPLAVVLAYEMGWAVFRSVGLAVAVVLGQVALRVLAQGHGGIYPDLWQPGQAATQLFLPAVVALFFALRAQAVLAGRPHACRRLRRPRAHSPHLRALHRDSADRVRRRALAAHARPRPSQRDRGARRPRPADGARLPLAATRRRAVGRASPRLERTRREPSPLQARPRHPLADAVHPRTGAGRPAGRGADRGARGHAARLLRAAAALGRPRARRDGGHPRARPLAARLPALLQHRLALAVPACSGLHPVRARPGGRGGRARRFLAAPRARPRARRRDLAAALLSRRLRPRRPPRISLRCRSGSASTAASRRS